MISYILAGLVLYDLSKLITHRRDIAWLAALLFWLNPNAWYMQSLAMSELLLIAFFALTANCLARWVITKDSTWLIATALALVGATLTRYDGWFLLATTSAIVFFFLVRQYRQRQISLSQAEAYSLSFLALACAGIIFWLGWNFVIYDHPLFFALGPYSAKAQQETIAASGTLFTDHNLRLSLRAYSWATLNNVGFIGTALALIGLVVWPSSWPRKKWVLLLPAATLFSPFIFHVLSLYSGNSILMTPELGLSDPQNPSSAWFNVRYGLMMLPAAAIWGTFFLKKRFWQIVVLLLLLTQSAYALTSSNIITLTDGTLGSSALAVSGEARWLSHHTQPDDLILTSIAYHSAFAFETGLPLRQFIHEGTDTLWQSALANPSPNTEWIIMMNGDVGDPVYNALIKKNNHWFNQHYQLAHRGRFLSIYQRSEFIIRHNHQLYYKGQPFRFVGVNVYDLLYQQPDGMRATIKQAKKDGFSVIRFWAFGEGFPGSLQSNAGIINENAALKLDLLIHYARQENVRLVPVLGNYWPEYGGVPHYLGWLGLPGSALHERDVFFTHPDARHLYWNFIEKIVNRHNQIDNTPYQNDPTIMAWEIMNEPRSASLTNQAIIATWQQDLAKYIHQLDPHHPIISGVEGFVNPVYNDPAGPNFTVGNNSKSLDIASGHLYRKYLNNPNNVKDLTDIMKIWSKQARQLNKPLIIGEVGFSSAKLPDREDWFIKTLQSAQQNEISGLFLWSYAYHVDTPYNISPVVPADQDLLKSIRPLIPTTPFYTRTRTD